MVLMKSDVVNFCQHVDFRQDPSKLLGLNPIKADGESKDVPSSPTQVSFASIRPHVQTLQTALRAGLFWAVGGQHKNYPIINNIPEQREQAILQGPSLHVELLKAICPRPFPKWALIKQVNYLQYGAVNALNIRSAISFTLPVGNTVWFLVWRQRRMVREACGLLSVKQESAASQ